VEWNTYEKKLIIESTGVPQGGILSPLLSNLVLHELDVYMEKLIKEKEEKRKNLRPSFSNPTYQKLTSQISKLKRKKSGDHHKDRNLRLELKKLVKERRKIKSTKPNPEYVRFEYARYADD
jgi:retron-type reverse transcriptase